VPAAILFDLDVGRADVRPDAAMGYAACQAAGDGPVAEGSVGAGTGCMVGKILGHGRATKSGLGTASAHLGGGLVVGAVVAVNAFGDVLDPRTGNIVAGVRTATGEGYADTLAVMKSLVGKTISRFARQSHTVIGVAATNARLTKEQTNKVAQMAHDGLARTVRPAHTMFDGDTLFALATGQCAPIEPGCLCAEVVAEAIVRRSRGEPGDRHNGLVLLRSDRDTVPAHT
jgi:L-aminopeptidase/D-esterase-like protein